jgi:hypothetical protein
MKFEFEMSCYGDIISSNTDPNDFNFYIPEENTYTLYVEVYIGDIPIKISQFNGCKRLLKRRYDYISTIETLVISIPVKETERDFHLSGIIPDYYYLGLEFLYSYTLLFPFHKAFYGSLESEGFHGMKRIFIVEGNNIYVKLIYDVSKDNIEYIKKWI